MIIKILIAWCLVATTVAIHSAGLAYIFSQILRSPQKSETHFGQITWLLIRIAWCLIVVHMCEIAVWGLFYWWENCLPDAESSFYFAGVTYTTVGYGDIVLPKEWRLFGPVEGLTGILMCGLSTGFFFFIFSKRIRATSASRHT
jgi:hypothetical protein